MSAATQIIVILFSFFGDTPVEFSFGYSGPLGLLLAAGFFAKLLFGANEGSKER